MTDFVVKYDSAEYLAEVFDPLEDDEPIACFAPDDPQPIEKVLAALGFDVAVE